MEDPVLDSREQGEVLAGLATLLLAAGLPLCGFLWYSGRGDGPWLMYGVAGTWVALGSALLIARRRLVEYLARRGRPMGPLRALMLATVALLLSGIALIVFAILGSMASDLPPRESYGSAIRRSSPDSSTSSTRSADPLRTR
jgi:hypothetical protein